METAAATRRTVRHTLALGVGCPGGGGPGLPRQRIGCEQAIHGMASSGSATETARRPAVAASSGLQSGQALSSREVPIPLCTRAPFSFGRIVLPARDPCRCAQSDRSREAQPDGPRRALVPVQRGAHPGVTQSRQQPPHREDRRAWASANGGPEVGEGWGWWARWDRQSVTGFWP